MKKMRSRGLTLIELVVVIAILAVLAMIIIPKLDGLQNNANHAAASASVNDTGRYLQTWRTTKQNFPNGWDSLTDGTAMWAPANVANKTKGLHPTAFATGGKFAEGSLTAADTKSLIDAGISVMFDANTALTGKRPGDMFVTRRVLAIGDTPKAVFVNKTSTSGQKIIDSCYRDNGRKGTTGLIYDASGTDVTASRQLLAVGFGPLNDMVGKLTMEAPAYANVDSSLIYNRNIVLFEVGGSKALFKGVVAADGDLLDDLTTYINRDIQ
jgi:prepilin-type N-terminal cleavage/methylation domain-containing protein